MANDNRELMSDIFLGLQEQMLAKLSLNRRVLNHPVAKGDATELEWIDLLSAYLPTRYRVERAFVIDHRGAISEQIDIVIFDRHFSPFLFRQNGQSYVPAESVYAAIEVKAELCAQNLKYAAGKVASVRSLERTSAEIVDRGERHDPRDLTYIYGGILAIDGVLTEPQARQLLEKDEAGFLDIGCSLAGNAFFIDPLHKHQIELSQPPHSLIFFFLKLLQGLQSVGTVAPIEISKYASNLKSSIIRK